MRRSIFWIALAFAGAIWITLSIPLPVTSIVRHAPAVILIGVYAGYIAFCLRYNRLMYVLIGITAGIVYAALFHTYLIQPVRALNGKTMVIEAEVRSVPDIYDDSQRAEVRILNDSIGLHYPFSSFSAIGYLPLTDQPLMPGDKIEALVTFYEPTVRQGFDRTQYQRANGNFISFQSVKDTKTKQPVQFYITYSGQNDFHTLPQRLGRMLSTQLRSILPQREGGFLCSILLGDRSHLDPIDQQNLQKVGLSHVIAVSGLHLMFLIGFIQRVFSRRIGIILSFFAILFFIPMVGSAPSILRAGIMCALSGIAFLFGRESDGQTSLGIALLFLLLINPYSIFSLSLQLSFLSTFGILRYASQFEHIVFWRLYALASDHPIYTRLLHICGAAVSCSLCATLFTSPVLISSFGYITLLSLPSNILTLSVISFIFILGLLLCLIPATSVLLTIPITILIDYVLNCAQVLGHLHWGVLYWEETSGRIAVCAILLLIIVILAHQVSHPKFTIPFCCCVLIGATGYAHWTHCNMTRITLHAVGEGQMISIAQGYRHLSVVDCGGSANIDNLSILRQTMNWYGLTKIDTLLLTAVDKAHARAADTILKEIPVEQLIVPDHLRDNETLRAIQAAVEQYNIPMQVCSDDMELLIAGIAHTHVMSKIDRKLAVYLKDSEFDMLILHSMTQNMLRDFLTQTPFSANRVVLSNHFEKEDLIKQALEILSPQEIILSSGYSSVQYLFDIPIRSTMQAGDLTWTIYPS